jgi:hypothetical protein
LVSAGKTIQRLTIVGTKLVSVVTKISMIVNESMEIKDKSLIMVVVVVSCFANQTYPSPSKNGFIQLYRYLLCL